MKLTSYSATVCSHTASRAKSTLKLPSSWRVPTWTALPEYLLIWRKSICTSNAQVSVYQQPFIASVSTCRLNATAEAVLEADEAIDAEIYVNKASALINAAAAQAKASADDVYGPVQLRFRVTYARVLDANRKFVEAAVRYYGLSTTTGYNVRYVFVTRTSYTVLTQVHRLIRTVMISPCAGRAGGPPRAAGQGRDLRDPGQGGAAAEPSSGAAHEGSVCWSALNTVRCYI
jgi:hypothetical protein